MDIFRAKRIYFLLVIIGLLPSIVQAKKLTFSVISNHINVPITTKILVEVYQRLGIEINIVQHPAPRALVLSNGGATDGEVFRVLGIEKKFPNLVLVPECYLVATDVVYTKKAQFVVNGYESLRPYRIGIRRGIKIAETSTEGMNRVVVNSYSQLFELLDRGRIDVLFVNNLQGEKILKELKLKHIYALSPPLQEVKLYHYLHKKNAALVPKVNQIFLEMKKEKKINCTSDTKN